jgi:hypothetical protein
MSKLLHGPTTPKNLSILHNFVIFLHLFNLYSCQQGRTRNCYSGSCWAIVWTNIAWIMAAYLCRISNLHWFKCPPTCPQDDFHACMNQKQNKFTMLHCFFNLIQQTTFPLQGVNARFEHTFCDEDSMGWLRRHLFQLLLVHISRNDL